MILMHLKESGSNDIGFGYLSEFVTDLIKLLVNGPPGSSNGVLTKSMKIS